MTDDDIFMLRCIELAGNGAGNVAPNPMVGCVIVCEGKIIGEGFHEKFGKAHAEVNAISSVSDQSQLRHSSLYVNLEPCSHFGKTPPCADLIIEKKIPEVIIGCADPDPLVAGKGIHRLQSAACKVRTEILNHECIMLNKRFITFHEKKRPYILLKWAQTRDGFIAPENKMRANISNEFSRTLMHRWRSEKQAIFVGTNTALSDDPQLSARLWNKNNPVRIVLDRQSILPPGLHLFDHTIPTLVFTEKKKNREENLEFIQISFDDALLINILTILFEKQIQSVMVEGGAQLLQSFISRGLWDEARIFIAPAFFSSGVSAPKISGIKTFEQNIHDDQLVILENKP
ncbi:MAG: bifunctional diaminohydroxyphosphoribosylaminopyrimidine deaminase/5-amino-6-(5-phosphoribosylamino)uracil reductase RibD [Chitinophagales bacterium]